MNALKDQLQAVLDRYVAAYIAKDAVGCAAIFAADAAVYSPYGPPALGRAAIAAQHEEWVPHGGDTKTLIVQDHGGGGDVAWCLAHYSEGGAAGNGASLMVFDRHPGGAWLVRTCSMNSLD